MKLSNGELLRISQEALLLAKQLESLAFDLMQVSKDNLSPGDANFFGIASAEDFLRKHKASLERMG